MTHGFRRHVGYSRAGSSVEYCIWKPRAVPLPTLDRNRIVIWLPLELTTGGALSWQYMP